jgi:hypothetical protein
MTFFERIGYKMGVFISICFLLFMLWYIINLLVSIITGII